MLLLAIKVLFLLLVLVYVAIDQNRGFVCRTGTVQGITAGSSYGTVTSTTGHTVPGGTYPYSSVPGGTYSHTGVPVSTGRAFTYGEFYIQGNGQESYAYITVGSSSPLNPQAVCKIGFSCL